MSAAEIGVNYQAFAYWRQKRKNRQQAMAVQAAASVQAALMAPQPGSGPRWVKAVVEPGGGGHEQAVASEPEFKLELRGEASVELSIRGQINLAADLLNTLERKGQAGC